MLGKILSYFRISSIDSEVIESQVNAFTKQGPLLHVILNTSALALAYTHYGIAPDILTLYIPSIFLLLSLIRVVMWVRPRKTKITRKEARQMLRAMQIVVGLFSVVFVTWSLSLYPYGDAYAKGHVAFFMSITVIGSITCLMHLRPAALLVAVIMAVPFMVRFMTTGEPVLTAIAINFCLVLIIIVYILCIYYRDFTNLVHSQSHLAALSDENFRMANRDSLTDLPNRRSFFRDLDLAISAQNSTGFALGIIDLDGFKPVNDVYGHAAGDRVLVETGRRLKALLGPTSLVARLGGDEFGIVIPLAGGSADILERGAEICRAIQVPVHLPNGTAQVAASIGFALHLEGETTQEHLVERADYALYYAKAKHRGTAVIFSCQHETAIRAQGRIEQELRRADFQTEIKMQFQPIFEVGRNKIVAYEALARWTSPVLGSVSPLDFIAAAERTGLINKLTEVLFAKALAALETWPDDIDLSFNLSVRDIANPEMIARIRQMVSQSTVCATRIAFEVTETALVHDFDQAHDMLFSLKTLGAKISLDDFGTGYSSLSYVHRLPLDKIKIDRAFIAEITSNRASRDIVKTIVDLSRNLKMTCIVEGVETAEQMIVLRALGCSTMQGYFFGRPADAEALPHLLIGAQPSPAQIDAPVPAREAAVA